MTLRDDDGLTLVELIVTIVVSALVAGLAALVFANAITVQRSTAARDQMTGQANAASASLTQSVRNAIDIRISGGGSRLDAVVIRPDGVKECRAWAMVDGGLRYSAGDGPRPPAATTWSALVTGATGTLSGQAFESHGRAVSIGLDVRRGSQIAMISNTVAPQAKASPDTEGVTACW